MRIIFYTGKGGVGKTSIACATGLQLAEAGHKTLILSLDVAHSVADAFDIERELLDKHEGQPLQLADNLFIQEIDVQAEIHRWWGEVHQYLTLLFNTTGMDGVVADELAILPGMQEVSLLLYINKYHRDRTFDILVLDCAPTGESIRFISVPTALEWYMNKIFKTDRLMMRALRPIMKIVNPSLPLPEDKYFLAIRRLADKLQGVDSLLHDPAVTSVRIVTLPEKIVIKETQRAFMYFSLYGLITDAVIVNRLIPDWCDDPFLSSWKTAQQGYLKQIHELFAPVPIWTVEMFKQEVLGMDGLRHLAEVLYRDVDPLKIHYSEPPVSFHKDPKNGDLRLTLRLPWVSRGELDITRVGSELILNVGGFKKHIELPRTFAGARPTGASIKGDQVTIRFKEKPTDGE